VTVHITLPRLHLPHPSWAQVHSAVDFVLIVAGGSGWTFAAITAAGLGYGPHLAAVLLLGSAGYAGYLIGAHRASRHLHGYYGRVLVGVQRVNSAQQQQAARELVKLATYAAADRDPHAVRRDRHINSAYAGAYISGKEGSR
jgi:hypothetical protein